MPSMRRNGRTSPSSATNRPTPRNLMASKASWKNTFHRSRARETDRGAAANNDLGSARADRISVLQPVTAGPDHGRLAEYLGRIGPASANLRLRKSQARAGLGTA